MVYEDVDSRSSDLLSLGHRERDREDVEKDSSPKAYATSTW